MDEEKLYEAHFMQIVMSLQGSAWMMLGKTMNPITGKIEKNLDAAKSAIDTLMMLKAKTKGNLSKTEDDFLSNTLQQLQINYVEELKAEKEKPVEDKKEEKFEQKNLKKESKEPEDDDKQESNTEVKEEKKKEEGSDSESKDKKPGGEKND